jgi:3-methyladenine DNA glycosylase AlkD
MGVPRTEDIRERLAVLDDRSTPSVRRVRRELSKELRGEQGRAVLQLVLALLDAKACPRWFAYEIAHHHAGAMARLSKTWLSRLGAGMSSWDEVDPFACYLLGPAWREGRVSGEYLQSWAKSRDRWQRRAALAAPVALNNTARGGSGDATRTLAICNLLASDRDDMIVKALSWALRELSGKEPRAVEDYLSAHAARLPARVLREVRSKLATGLKNTRHASASSRSASRPRSRSSRR